MADCARRTSAALPSVAATADAKSGSQDDITRLISEITPSDSYPHSKDLIDTNIFGGKS